MKHIRRMMFDSLLSAMPPGKVLVAGDLWQGGPQPKIDEGPPEPFGPIVSGFTSGHVLNAQQKLSPSELDLSRRYIGGLRSTILDAAGTHRTPAPDDVDAAPVLREIDRAEAVLATQHATFADFTAGCNRIKAASDRASRGRRAGDAATLAQITASDRARVADMDREAKKLWGSGPSRTVRDAEMAITRAASTRELIDAINARNRLPAR